MQKIHLLIVGLLSVSLFACAPMVADENSQIGIQSEQLDSLDEEAEALLDDAALEEELAQEDEEELLDATESDENIADWVGVYQGILPCASCEGIETELILDDDLTYSRTVRFVGEEKETTVDGQFSWISDNLIRLDAAADGSVYFVGDGLVQMRAQDGSEMASPLSDKYILNKQD